MTVAHEHWTSRIGFIMATAGSAIGLGSLWRFPYIAGENGGGAFVLLYLVFTFFIGLPVFLAELVIGRKAGTSSVLAYSGLAGKSEGWRGLGWLNVLTCLLILSYYSVVSGWCLSYTFMSLNQFALGKNATQIQSIFQTLTASPGINLFWLALFLAINAAIILSGVRKGIEYWSKILMPALFAILIALLVYAITMPGFGEAARFVFVPDFAKLTPSGVLNALGMALFTLSVGLGILVTYGSYMGKEDNIPYNGSLIALMTILVSILAALTIFPIVFTFHFPPEAGPGLVFQTLPVLFAKLPGTIFLSTIFFSLLLFAALTSTISLLEVLVANLMENFRMTRKQATLLCTAVTFIIGVPSALSSSGLLFPTWESIYGKNFFDTISYITASWFMPVAALLTTLFIGWRLPKRTSYQEFLHGTKRKWLVYPWFFLVRYLAPVAIIVIIFQEAGIIKL